MQNWLNVCTARSANPLERGWYEEVSGMYYMIHFNNPWLRSSGYHISRGYVREAVRSMDPQ